VRHFLLVALLVTGCTRPYGTPVRHPGVAPALTIVGTGAFCGSVVGISMARSTDTDFKGRAVAYGFISGAMCMSLTAAGWIGNGNSATNVIR
jgi:hydroxyethylthiazole kinase-like sugar kinase family protein